LSEFPAQQTPRIHPARRIHPLGRLSFAVGMLATLLLVQRDIPGMSVLLVISMLLISWLSASWLPVWRAARLLLWLVLPILCLHMLFTPGELLWPASWLHVTREGWHEGVLLGLRLSAMFYAAMLVSRSLSREEWVWCCLSLPVLGAFLLPYVKLSLPMRGMASQALSQARMTISLRSAWRDAAAIPRALGDAIENVWHASDSQAEQLWKNWDQEEAARRVSGNVTAGILLAVLGVLMPVSVWMVG